MLDADYRPEALATRETLIADYRREAAARLPVRPLSALAQDHLGIDPSQFAIGTPRARSAYGVVASYAFGLLMSLNMLIEGVGFDYTGADCRGWMADAGFRESYVEHLVGPDSMVIGIK